ncbi:glycoside hydrolase family 2 TIM barrel-domain containing protein [Ulvibacterium sp.]|uniref:glycoside hydrolase family 2 TIM barrel-domain containing protein n=1 Tax=Ulvibacterium sp. TaxID=2665914 RepID=UPI003BAA7B4C
MKSYLSFLLYLWFLVPLVAQRTSFNTDWRFVQADVTGAEQPNFDDVNWKSIKLPHDWSIEGEYSETHAMSDWCGYLPAGIGWYRKTIKVPKSWKGKHVEIAFDGVFMNSTVWANGIKLGHRPYGWISFEYDISEIVDTYETITFSVRVDNDKQPSARWYTGSGIYANTWIDINEEIHVPKDGIFIHTEGSNVYVETKVVNKTSEKEKINVVTTIFDAEGNIVANKDHNTELAGSGQVTIKEVLTVNDPKLWTPKKPYLYKAVTQVHRNKISMDEVNTRFGIRDIKWLPETGMWLNGKNVKLRGVCNHQDGGAMGAAVPYKILRFRLQQLKDMGVNAIRTAHNPQTPEFYDICDELGLLVMDEIFDGWMRKATNDYGAHSFDEWWRTDLTDWIKRDRNHPSIVIYSVGNETRGEIGKDLVTLCHELDNTRPVTSGHSGSEFMDVFGVNGHSEKKGWFEEMPKDRVFIGTENPHTWQVRGYYRTKTWYRDGYPSKRQKPYEIPDLTEKEVFSNDWVTTIDRGNRKQIFNSSYDNATVRMTARHSIAQLRDIPEYAGSFRWTGHDYLGEAGYVHGGWPFKASMTGAIDLANFEKDLYYLYQSQWTTEPMVHLLPHWTHPKMELGTKIPVWAYSNGEEVELFFNGTSLGKKRSGKEWNKMQCQWMVPWQPGELKAVAYRNGKVVTQKTIKTADAPSKIRLSVDGEPLLSSGEDIVQVRATLTDSEDEMYPYGENRVYFHVVGDGQIKALDNGSPIDVERYYEASDRIAFYGLTRAYVTSNASAKPVNFLTSAILGEKKLITSNEVTIAHTWLNLRGTVENPEVKIFYTTDGSEPTIASQPYEKPFKIALGTTVKALVMLDGNPIYNMEERFAPDEGFLWNEIVEEESPTGEQAESATFKNTTIGDSGKGFHGKGYLKFDNALATVSWYQENDGGAGEADLYIRYSCRIEDQPGTYLKVTVNGKELDKPVFARNTRGLGSHWNKVKVPIKLQRGANTIALSAVEKKPIHIDEIMIN